jgi:DNA-binding MarR family transcriptional regulator
MKQQTSRLDEHLGFWLRKLSNQVSEGFAKRVKKHDCSVAQWVVLRVLFDHDALPLKEVVARVGVDQGSLSRMVDRLLLRGLVSRRENPSDRREISISLTKEGRKLVPMLAREADENDREFFMALTKTNRAQFLKTIHSLLSQNGSSEGMPIR